MKRDVKKPIDDQRQKFCTLNTYMDTDPTQVWAILFSDNVVTNIYSASPRPDEHPYSLASLVPWLMTAKLFARFTESRFYLSVHQLFDFIKLLLL